MRRKLGSVEYAFTLNGRAIPLAAISVLQIYPALDPAAFPPALADLQRQHPLLRATLLTRDSDFFFEIGPDAPTIPFEALPRRNDDHWRQVATAELNREIGQEGTPLMRLTYLFSEMGGAADLIFTYHHSMIDAASGVQLLNQFLTLCTGKAAADQPARCLVPPAEKSFPAPYLGLRGLPKKAAYMASQMADEIQYRIKARGTRSQPIHASASCAILTRKLAVEVMANLIQQCRRNRITLNSLLSAALLSAVHKHLYNSQPGPQRAIMFSNLRPYLNPPLPDEDLGCMVTMLRYTIEVGREQDLWQLAARFKERNETAHQRGEKFLATFFAPSIVQMTLRLKAFRLATTAVSFAGPINLKEQYGPITVKAMHNFVSNNRFGPEYVSTAHLLFGELIWNFLYLDSDMTPETAEAIADEACRLLIDASGSGIVDNDQLAAP